MNQLVPVQGKCNSCEYGYYNFNRYFISKCGDGIVTINE